MKYFTYELIAAANGWTDQTDDEEADARRRFEEAVVEYRRALTTVKPKIGKRAWEFFANDAGPRGLHDGRLVSLSVGDSLDYEPDGSKPLRINSLTTKARIVFLNCEQQYLYTFELREVSSFETSLHAEEYRGRGLGDLYAYEILLEDDGLLRIGFLFASGATIVADFRKLVFRRRRL